MNDTNWIGKVCPYCGKLLGKTDNVIFCSRCGIPYHAACWHANKGCKFHDGYGRPYENVPPPSQDAHEGYAFYCPDCGTMVSADAHNCVQCGSYIAGRIRRGARTASFQSAAKDVYSQRYGLEKAYIGRNEGCYLEKFRAIRTNSTLISWNWCAFLFPPFWFLYRKMYQWATVFGLAPLLLSLVLVEEVLLLVGFAGCVLAGLFADVLYLRQIEKYAGIGSCLPEQVRYMHIAKNGGVNPLAAGVALAAYLFLIWYGSGMV